MYRLAAWVAVLCMAISSHVFEHRLVNLSVLACILWVIFDGVMVASELRAAEADVKNIQGQLRFQNNHLHSQNMVQEETLKHIQENSLLLSEIRMRMIMINQKLKRQLSTHTEISLQSVSIPTQDKFNKTQRKPMKRSYSIL